MKSLPEKPLQLPKITSIDVQRSIGNIVKKIVDTFHYYRILLPILFIKYWQILKLFLIRAKKKTISKSRFVAAQTINFVNQTKVLGFTDEMNDYEKRKLGIFNQLNLFQFFTGLIAPLVIIFSIKTLTISSALVLISPSLTSLLALYLNSRHKTEISLLCYFILYPFFTSLAYIGGMNLGVDLFFVLYGILSVFFLKEIGYIAFCIGFSMVNYFMLAVVLKFYRYNLETSHPFFYMLNQFLAIVFIFYGLYLIKKENNEYQASLLSKNTELQDANMEIKAQKENIAEKVEQLEEQAIQLNEVDKFKNRLFSIVSHDLKNPMYALRNLFTEIQEDRIPAREIKKLIPHVIKDLNFTTGLMDNLLHWAKTQMNTGSITPQDLDITGLINEIIQQHRLQAGLKNITIEYNSEKSVFIYADRDMVSLVIRNLLSNAIKFTPVDGNISIGTNESATGVEVYVADSGEGMDEVKLEKIRKSNYYSTKGTSNEPGTGLGLMLCKEFISQNNGKMHIESTPGKGSVFSFTLPLAS